MLEAERMDEKLSWNSKAQVHGDAFRKPPKVKRMRSNILDNTEYQFVQNCNAKVFRRFNMETSQEDDNNEGGLPRPRDPSSKSRNARRHDSSMRNSSLTVSLTDIMMENWTGSKVYEMVSEQKHQQAWSDSTADEESTDLTIEI